MLMTFKTLFSKKFNNSEVRIQFSTFWVTVGIDSFSLYYPDENTGENIVFQHGVEFHFLFIRISIIKHMNKLKVKFEKDKE